MYVSEPRTPFPAGGAGEAGFTLVELLVAMVAGIVVLFALTQILISTLHQTQRSFTRIDATRQARGYFTGYAPSSPQIAMFKDGKIVFMLERYQIEGRTADAIAADMTAAFDKYCAKETAAA